MLCHPEALLNTRKGQSLLTDPVFKDNVVAVVTLLKNGMYILMYTYVRLTQLLKYRRP